MRVQRATALAHALAAPSEPHAAAFLQRGQQADRQAASAVLAGHRHAAHRGRDQADVRIGLREIAPGLATVERQILRQQAQMIALFQQRFEHRARLVQAPDRGQRVDVPERADANCHA
ncbi:hypothetical protein G6F50_016563 [Rhizopus delemar]|uniref:Uncharacterized protein n=1 Tax=Rhizopus delemar TaxID=936053 RepID=A0A9P7C224_9FUNG|nr:hypothetical protein G6F50_016563 [Rhizopus delemar]